MRISIKQEPYNSNSRPLDSSNPAIKSEMTKACVVGVCCCVACCLPRPAQSQLLLSAAHPEVNVSIPDAPLTSGPKGGKSQYVIQYTKINADKTMGEPIRLVATDDQQVARVIQQEIVDIYINSDLTNLFMSGGLLNGKTEDQLNGQARLYHNLFGFSINIHARGVFNAQNKHDPQAYYDSMNVAPLTRPVAPQAQVIERGGAAGVMQEAEQPQETKVVV